jgi:DNA-binding XRE family transcriptional regulator
MKKIIESKRKISFKEVLSKEMEDPGMRKKINFYRRLHKITLELREARKNSGYTQERLSGLTGIPQGMISKIESGNRNITLETLDSLADAMDRDLVVTLRKRS